jgi:hypothetical protein
MLKKILLALVLVLLVIQIFRPQKNIHAENQPTAIQQRYAIPANVASTLNAACYDCHSNNTRYPWYSEIQPSAWFLADHVKEGKDELNFDEFLNYPAKRQDHKMKEVVEMVESGEMPMTSYTLVHGDARLSDQQKAELIDWANAIRKEINYQPVK